MNGHQLSIDDAVRERDGILGLLAADPRNSAHVRAVAEVIAAHVRPGQVFSANTIRDHVPTWVKPHLYGPAFRVLRQRGAIVAAGWEPSTDRRTHAKPVGCYRLVAVPDA